MPSARAERYRRWYAYEQDSHAKAIASLRAFRSVHGTHPAWQQAVDLLAHIAASRRLWLVRLGWGGGPVTDILPRAVGLDEAVRQLTDVEHEWSAVLARLEDADLDREFEYASLEGPRFRNRVEDILTQLFGHSWYHRGQIALLVRTAGGEPAVTDFVFWTREPLPG